MSKKLTILIAMLVLCLTTSSNAIDWAVYGLQMPDPGHSDSWDNSFGVETQARFGDSPLKPFLSLGVSQHDAEDIKTTSGWWIFQKTTTITGNVQAFSPGAGILYELEILEGVNLVSHAALKYHLMSSDVEMTVKNISGSSTIELEYDNLATLDLGANIEIEIVKNLDLLLGAAHMLDLNHEHVKASGEKLELHNAVEGTVVYAGLVIKTN